MIGTSMNISATIMKHQCNNQCCMYVSLMLHILATGALNVCFQDKLWRFVTFLKLGLNRLVHGLKWNLWQMLDHCPPLEPLPPKILFHASEKVAKLESFIILHFAPRYWPKWNLSLILVAKWLYFKFNLSANQGFNPSFYKISSNCKCGSYSCQ